ncbi:Alpha-ketoglutarate-dependent taurine dioxygenase [Exophiala dermatitidis]
MGDASVASGQQLPEPVLTVNGERVETYSDVKPTNVVYPDTAEVPALHQRALPLRPYGDHIPPKGIRKPVAVPKDRALSADPNLPNLLSSSEVQRVDLTPSLGTLITGIQLNALTNAQKDELALLVAHRGVVFFRDQDITPEEQRKLFDYYGVPEEGVDPENTKPKTHTIQEQEEDYRGVYVHFKWPFADFHADSSFQANPPSFSLLKIDTLPPTGGDTAWISGYGTYETLSKPLRTFLDGLSAWHSSGLVYDSVTNFWGKQLPERPVETLHPVVRTHPVTGYQVLNLNSGFVDRIDGLNRYESDKLLELLFTHIHTAQDHTVRFKWEKNSAALWDNRAVTHRATHDYAPLRRKGTRVTIKGQIPQHSPEGITRREGVIRALEAGKVSAVHDANTRNGDYKSRGLPKRFG